MKCGNADGLDFSLSGRGRATTAFSPRIGQGQRHFSPAAAPWRNTWATNFHGAAQETQRESDKKLNEAKKILENVQPQLTQHPKAAAPVAQALKDIGEALSIK
jgi:hypothetical protein